MAMPSVRLWGPKMGFTLTLLYVLTRSTARYFFLGRPFFGQPQDNATLFHEATTDYRGGPEEKLGGPLWRRVLWRWAVVGVPLALLVVEFVAQVVFMSAPVLPLWTTVPWKELAWTWWIILALALVAWGTRELVELIRHRKVTTEFVYPAWIAACGALAIPYRPREARRSVSLPEGFEPSDVEVDEPGGHSRASKLLGIARFRDWRALRRLQAEQANEQALAEVEEIMAEPSDVSPSELVVPPWPEVPAKNRKVTAEELSPEPVLEPPVRIMLPPGKCSTAKAQGTFLAAVGPVLGMPDPKASWTLRGRAPFVELRPNRPPPPAVTFAVARRHFLATDIDHPIIGLAPGNRVVTIDYANNSPHVLVSGGSGTGKSVLLKAILCQRMHLGSALIVLDYKRVSHRWAHNLPGCVYAWRIADLHEVACRAGELLEFRISTVLPDGEDTEVDLVAFPVVDLLVEEINSLTPQLQAYWSRIKEPGDVAQSPAVDAIKRIVNMGREYAMHVHIGAQRASANVFGANGGDIRESFQTRLMAKWTKQAWAMLAGGIPYERCPTRGGRGIWARVQDDEVEIVRTPFLTNAEAREWAMGGIPSPGTPLGGQLSTPIPSPRTPVSVPELVTLKAAIALLPGPPITLEALRKAAQRPGFPQPTDVDRGARTWDLDSLITWKLGKDEARGEIRPMGRPGICYRADVLDPLTGAVVCGYVGQTRRGLKTREAEHRADKPWADLIVGDLIEVWSSEDCTDDELDAAELHLIHALLPLYNWQGNEANPDHVPKWVAVDERQERQAAKGLPPWVPIDIYNSRQLPEEEFASYVLPPS